MPGFKTIHIDGFVELCKVNLTVTDLKVLAIYEEAGRAIYAAVQPAHGF